MTRLVVFDMAGTTVQDDDAVNACLAAALAHAGVERSREDINAVMGIPKPRAIDRLLGPMAGDATADADERTPEAAALRKAPDVAALLKTRVDAIHADFAERMIAHYKGSALREVEGASEVFKALKSVGVRVALDTGFDRRIANFLLRRLRWIALGLVDITVTSDEVANGRPAPDMIIRAMALMGVGNPFEVAKVGDTPSDLYEGTNAGCGLVVGYTGGTHTHEQLAAAPHTHLISHLRQFLDTVNLPRGVRGRRV
jgi:phosphonatase-like hydrolase